MPSARTRSRKSPPPAREGAELPALHPLSKDLSLVETVDFLPAVVDDPYTLGQIAAASALSSMWALGAEPLFALHVVGFPPEFSPAVRQAILEGGSQALTEAGLTLRGGRTFASSQPNYGLVVTGQVHPKRLLSPLTAKPGDVLLLTKPLGSGIAATAMTRNVAPKSVSKGAIALMSELNQAAGETFASGKFKVSALTAIGTHGLLGQLWQMALGSKVHAGLWLSRLPILEGVPALAAEKVIPHTTMTNLAHVADHVDFPEGLPEDIRCVLADVQFNGGLLAAVPEAELSKALRALDKKGVDAAVVGMLRKGKPSITVLDD